MGCAVTGLLREDQATPSLVVQKIPSTNAEDVISLSDIVRTGVLPVLTLSDLVCPMPSVQGVCVQSRFPGPSERL